MLVAAILLAVTGDKGGEIVYRHGLGVISTPEMRNHALIVHAHEAAAELTGNNPLTAMEWVKLTTIMAIAHTKPNNGEKTMK